MKETKLSRRAALQILGAVPVLSAVVSACGGAKDAPDSCSDVSGLSDAEKSARTALQYADASPYPDKVCKGCNLYQPSTDPAKCGGCQVVKGPIHPNGYCTSWVKKV